jgi:glucose-1-phosphate cytidylyltransferase
LSQKITIATASSAEYQLMAYRHEGFWKCMDMKKDVQDLNKMWDDNQAPWRFDAKLKAPAPAMT